MVFHAEALTRRGLVAGVLAAALLLLLSASSAPCAEESAVVKAAAWRIGDHLSLAGLLSIPKTKSDSIDGEVRPGRRL